MKVTPKLLSELKLRYSVLSSGCAHDCSALIDYAENMSAQMAALKEESDEIMRRARAFEALEAEAATWKNNSEGLALILSEINKHIEPGVCDSVDGLKSVFKELRALRKVRDAAEKLFSTHPTDFGPLDSLKLALDEAKK